MKKEKPYPNWRFTSHRDFKVYKRGQLRAVRRALEDFRDACAYCPGYDEDILPVYEAVERLAERMSEREWGR